MSSMGRAVSDLQREVTALTERIKKLEDLTWHLRPIGPVDIKPGDVDDQDDYYYNLVKTIRENYKSCRGDRPRVRQYFTDAGPQNDRF